MRFASLWPAVDSKAKLKVLAFLYGNYGAMSERELARMLRLSHASVNRIMREFHALDLVSPKRAGSALLWQANTCSFSYRQLQPLAQALRGLASPLEHLRSTIAGALRNSPAKRVVLFGSVAQGTERHGSDIDLFVLVNNEKDKAELSPLLDRLSAKCLDLYGNPLMPYVLSKNEFAQADNKSLLDNIKKGIIILSEADGR